MSRLGIRREQLKCTQEAFATTAMAPPSAPADSPGRGVSLTTLEQPGSVTISGTPVGAGTEQQDAHRRSNHTSVSHPACKCTSASLRPGTIDYSYVSVGIVLVLCLSVIFVVFLVQSVCA